MSESTTDLRATLEAQCAQCRRDLEAWEHEPPFTNYATWARRRDQLQAALSEAERQLREVER